MKITLVVQNVVCLAAVGPSVFDMDAFATRLDLGPAEQQFRLPQLAFSEWRDARLQILLDRLQLGFREVAKKDLVERVLLDFIDQASSIAPKAPIGFNAVLKVEIDEGDIDPSSGLLNAPAIAESLGGVDGRGGITVVYKDDQSRWWVELSPVPDNDRMWTFDFNRQFAAFPIDKAQRAAIITWFKDIEANILTQFNTVVKAEHNA